MNCGNNLVYSVNTSNTTSAILLTTSATTGSGMIYNNLVRGLDVAGALMVTAAAVQYGVFNNYYQADAGTSGELVPPAGVNT